MTEPTWRNGDIEVRIDPRRRNHRVLIGGKRVPAAWVRLRVSATGLDHFEFGLPLALVTLVVEPPEGE